MEDNKLIEVIENNRIIAEFMGAKKMNDGTMRFCYASPQEPHHDVNFHDGTSGRKLDELKYHTSWDWLMPVVKNLKSNRTNPEHTFISVAFGKLNLALMEAEITPVYKEVVNIIKLYNLNK